jgi:hypothetical protein
MMNEKAEAIPTAMIDLTVIVQNVGTSPPMD